jgi:hypothetical protein
MEEFHGFAKKYQKRAGQTLFPFLVEKGTLTLFFLGKCERYRAAFGYLERQSGCKE